MKNTTKNTQSILLIRHGMTEGNRHRRYIGITDEPLCPEGIEQLAEVQMPLRPDKVFASPMRRCIQTAKILFPELEPTIITELKEMNFGIFENRAWNGDLENDPQYLEWLETKCEALIPGGEVKEAFIRRCVAGFHKALTASANTDTIAIVAHGGTIMSILSQCTESIGGFYSWKLANGHGFVGEWDNTCIRSLQAF